jgi:hypothetical protein
VGGGYPVVVTGDVKVAVGDVNIALGDVAVGDVAVGGRVVLYGLLGCCGCGGVTRLKGESIVEGDTGGCAVCVGGIGCFCVWRAERVN